MRPKTDWLRLAEIQSRAEETLVLYHPSKVVPIPIEKIIGVTMGLDIVPVPGLKDAFDSDGYLATDRQTICVDEYVSEHCEARYRFTLAHELGHLILHKEVLQEWVDDWLRKHTLRTVDDHFEFVRRQDPVVVGKMEFQAYAFAGYLLIPADRLKMAWKKISPYLARHILQAIEAGFDKKDYSDEATESAAELLCDGFMVSSMAMKRQIERAIKGGVLSLPVPKGTA